VPLLCCSDKQWKRIWESESNRQPTNNSIESGPNWIRTWDSGEVHPIYKLAVETGTSLHHWNSKQLLYDTAGNSLPDEETDHLSTLLWKFIDEAFKFSTAAHAEVARNGCSNSIPKEDSLQDLIKKRALAELQDESERKTLLQMSEMWGAYVGEPVWKQSLRFAWMEECCAGGASTFLSMAYSYLHTWHTGYYRRERELT
jgi:hypothetical protein